MSGQMRVAFRADASLSLGTGHLVRSLTLAEALAARGAQCHFFCRDLPEPLAEEIQDQGYGLTRLDMTLPDGPSTHRALAAAGMYDWLVIDHYGWDAGMESPLRDRVGHIAVLDDLANRPHDCDLLIDTNLSPDDAYDPWLPPGTRRLLGPAYALLRPQFLAHRSARAGRAGEIRRVMVFAGGTDEHGVTLRLLEAVRQGMPEAQIEVIVGAANPHRASLDRVCRDLPAVVLSVQVADMAARMAQADLFVGAGGSSSWERCCLGLPAVIVACADNQVATSRRLAELGAQLYAGPAGAVDVAHLARVVAVLAGLPELRSHLASQAWALVDGQGAGRVAAVMTTESGDGTC